MYFITTKRMLEVCFFQHTPTFIIEPFFTCYSGGNLNELSAAQQARNTEWYTHVWRYRMLQVNVRDERTGQETFNCRHEKTPVLAYRSSFTQILKKGDVWVSNICQFRILVDPGIMFSRVRHKCARISFTCRPHFYIYLIRRYTPRLSFL